MRSATDLLPTEALLLLDVRKVTGEDLLFKAIEELIYLKLIKVKRSTVEGYRLPTLYTTSDSNIEPKEYQRLLLSAIQEHHNFHKELTLENALTPKSLVEIVHCKLGFSYNSYKFEYVYERLKLWDLVRARFPFYYLGFGLTPIGKKIRTELVNLLLKHQNEVKLKSEGLATTKSTLGANVILTFWVKQNRKRRNRRSTGEHLETDLEMTFSGIELSRHAHSQSDFEFMDFDWDN